MIGIYLIKNNINNKVYIGQSNNIERRWKEHRLRSFNPNHIEYNTLIHKAIRKYGLENFSFELLEKCNIDDLNQKEVFWIKHFKSNNHLYGYNSTTGGNTSGNIVISDESLLEIRELLKNTKLTQTEISKRFNTSQRLISYINDGTFWYDENIEYPIRKRTINLKCPICGEPKSRNGQKCKKCQSLIQRKTKRPEKHILKGLIKEFSFAEIGRQYNVSPTTIKRWCKLYGLPQTKKEIETTLS